MPKRPSGDNRSGLESIILKHIRSQSPKSFTYKKLAQHFVNSASRGEVAQAITALLEQGKIVETKKGRLRVSKESRKTFGVKLTGTVDLTAAGSAFVVSPQSEEDIFVARRFLGGAFDSDTVRVELFRTKPGRRPEGKIISVVERSRELFVGTVEPYKSHAFVVPDKRKVPADIFIPDVGELSLKAGQRVIAKVLSWDDDAKNPRGEIVEVLGTVGEHDVEMQSIIVDNGFYLHFQQDALDEAEVIPIKPKDESLKGRRDFRDITTFTIDPDDAKDFDDALSLKKLENGNWEIGIHIADVSHYVRPGSALDKAAYRRATSVYLVDRVAPMLPERLSNIVCSLRPNEDKLCFSVVVEMDAKANVLKTWFGRTVIRSDKRFTYDEVQGLIEKPSGVYSKELGVLNELATKLREVRFKNGSIAFETVELKFELDVQGVPIGVFEKERNESHMLVEDYMLLANQLVAERVGKRKKDKGVPIKPVPFVYRIHDRPNEIKLADFGRFAKEFGYHLQLETPNEIQESLNQLLNDIRGKPEQNVLEQLAIRAMAKAIYSPRNIGHFGLGFKYYTHFTSPIRRYPDLIVHRLLADYLLSKGEGRQAVLDEQCRHCSDKERNAMVAERESVKYKQVEFMQDKIGKVYDGVITGVTSFGLFVEMLETRCEGLINLRRLEDDFYTHDEPGLRLVGLETGRTFTLGETVRVVVIKTDLVKRTIDLELVLQSRLKQKNRKARKE